MDRYNSANWMNKRHQELIPCKNHNCQNFALDSNSSLKIPTLQCILEKKHNLSMLSVYLKNKINKNVSRTKHFTVLTRLNKKLYWKTSHFIWFHIETWLKINTKNIPFRNQKWWAWLSHQFCGEQCKKWQSSDWIELFYKEINSWTLMARKLSRVTLIGHTCIS